MSGLSDIWQTFGNLVIAVNGIRQSLADGIAIIGSVPGYAVAALPATAATGTLAFASDGRKPGEGAGAGTGMQVFFDGNHWISVSSGAPVHS